MGSRDILPFAVTRFDQRTCNLISLITVASGLPEPLAVIDINGEGLHTDPKRLLHGINSMKGVKPRS